VTEIRDGMRIDWDVPIVMNDGVPLRADVYRPIDETPGPVLLTYGPYGKGVWLPDRHPAEWQRLCDEHPDALANSTNRYQAWEAPDPEKWVPHGYACVRVDSRGAGRSPGVLNPHSPREIADTHQCVEWAGTQPWSNGKVGMLGCAYHATNSWLVASSPSPPAHLAAICAWEGSADFYRDAVRHGGILTTAGIFWWEGVLLALQHGKAASDLRNPNTGEMVTGPEILPEAELAANRSTLSKDMQEHALDDAWMRARSAAWENLTTPFLSAANWGTAALHLRGNVEAFTQAPSHERWLEIHGLEHGMLFYTDYGVDLQRRFFDCFLKGERDGWRDQRRVSLQVRRPDGGFISRAEDEWPIARTDWTRLYLSPEGRELSSSSPHGTSTLAFDALGQGLRFVSPPAETEFEITGPLAAKLFVSSSTSDADLFLVVHVIDPEGNEVTFRGGMDPLTSVGKGWLRASHRKLDATRSRPYRPYHTHDEIQPLAPGTTYELDVEIWPTSVVVPPGHSIGLRVLGRDYVHEGSAAEAGSGFPLGSGPFFHNDQRDRPEAVFAGTTTLHFGPSHQNFLLLPMIPADT
jgi:hypothetical protein